MKKLLMGLLAVGVVLALAMPASAFDSEFGGYFRARAYMQNNFSGSDTGAQDLTRTDMRTRLFYTAVFSEDFKFVNKFEFNSTFGDVNTGGEIASNTGNRDIFRIKNSYVNFNLGSFNFMVGIQPRVLNRGFLVDTDFAGISATYKAPGIDFPFIWMKAYEGGQGDNANDNDVYYYALKPTFRFVNRSLTPTLVYMYSKDATKWSATTGDKKIQVYFVGLDADVKFDSGSVWFTGIYEGGSVDKIRTGWTLTDSVDVRAYLLAVGGQVNIGTADIHGQIFYATGDDTGTADKVEAFTVPRGQMYYWAEIMGYGIFDNQVSANACADQISNTMAANIGVGFKVSDAVKITADLWYAKLLEDTKFTQAGTLGTEIDVVLTYSLMKNLNLDLVGAYLFAGDATYGGSNSKNPYELGTRLSFSF